MTRPTNEQVLQIVHAVETIIRDMKADISFVLILIDPKVGSMVATSGVDKEDALKALRISELSIEDDEIELIKQ